VEISREDRQDEVIAAALNQQGWRLFAVGVSDCRGLPIEIGGAGWRPADVGFQDLSHADGVGRGDFIVPASQVAGWIVSDHSSNRDGTAFVRSEQRKFSTGRAAAENEIAGIVLMNPGDCGADIFQLRGEMRSGCVSVFDGVDGVTAGGEVAVEKVIVRSPAATPRSSINVDHCQMTARICRGVAEHIQRKLFWFDFGCPFAAQIPIGKLGERPGEEEYGHEEPRPKATANRQE
jgi:hypothetical protein